MAQCGHRLPDNVDRQPHIHRGDYRAMARSGHLEPEAKTPNAAIKMPTLAMMSLREHNQVERRNVGEPM